MDAAAKHSQQHPEGCTAPNSGRPCGARTHPTLLPRLANSPPLRRRSLIAVISKVGPADLSAEWPELPYEAWRDTKDTLHMCLQVIGKVRLALTPLQPQWANVPLYLTARGLTTTPMWSGRMAFDVVVDFIDHAVIIHTEKGQIERIPLVSRPVADFYREFMSRLRSLDIEVEIFTTPSEITDPIPFTEDTVHATYDPNWANRFWRILSRVALVMEEHRARFRGKTSAVQFFWGSFDLANSRFSGRSVVPPANAKLIERIGGDAELICGGFWPGDDRLSEPAFFAYAYPKPVGIEGDTLQPRGAAWNAKMGEFIFPYEAARLTGDPRRAILDFLESTYDVGATRQGWSRDLVSRS